MKIVIPGGSGQVGTVLARAFHATGHEVVVLSRIRLWQSRACFIDWEQSSYGPLYVDLPNAFTVETALAYRDALARHGHTIPEVEFLERFLRSARTWDCVT